MIAFWTVAGVELAGLYDFELGRWKWGARRWSWPWQPVERDRKAPTRRRSAAAYHRPMDEQEIEIARWGAAHSELVDALLGARILVGVARTEARASALFDALGVSPDDTYHQLLELRDGRWALFGAPREGERFAVESTAPRPPSSWRRR